jgi:hypothetical protein
MLTLRWHTPSFIDTAAIPNIGGATWEEALRHPRLQAWLQLGATFFVSRNSVDRPLLAFLPDGSNYVVAYLDESDAAELPELTAERLDVQALLRKYIRHILLCEGFDFIPRNMTDSIRHMEQPFTQIELDLLHQLRKDD